MNHKPLIRKIQAIDGQGDVPNCLFILMDLLGYKSTEVGRAIGRSQNQMTYYRQNKTPLPKHIKRKIHDVLREVRGVLTAAKCDFSHTRAYRKTMIDLITKELN